MKEYSNANKIYLIKYLWERTKNKIRNILIKKINDYQCLCILIFFLSLTVSGARVPLPSWMVLIFYIFIGVYDSFGCLSSDYNFYVFIRSVWDPLVKLLFMIEIFFEFIKLLRGVVSFIPCWCSFEWVGIGFIFEYSLTFPDYAEIV